MPFLIYRYSDQAEIWNRTVDAEAPNLTKEESFCYSTRLQHILKGKDRVSQNPCGMVWIYVIS